MVQLKLVAALILTAATSAIVALPVQTYPHTQSVSTPWYRKVTNFFKSKPDPEIRPLRSPIPENAHHLNLLLSRMPRHNGPQVHQEVSSGSLPTVLRVPREPFHPNTRAYFKIKDSPHGVHILNNALGEVHAYLEDSKHPHNVFVINSKDSNTIVHHPPSGGIVKVYGNEGTTVSMTCIESGSLTQN